MASIPDSRDRSIRPAVPPASLTTLGGVGTVALATALTAVDGVGGLVVGLLVLGAALVSSGPAAFVLAQLGIISLVSTLDVWVFVATQCAAFLLLASAAYGRSPDARRLGRLAAVYVVNLGGVWVLQANFRWLWHSALSFVVLVAVVAYALHRYERVTVGLVTAEREQQ